MEMKKIHSEVLEKFRNSKISLDEYIDLAKEHSFNYFFLSSLNLEKVPEKIFELNQLKEIHFCGNKLDELPEDIYKLENLETLCLNDNYVKNLPKTIIKLTKLKDIRVPDNLLPTLPSWLFEIKTLERIDAGNNKIKRIPKSIKKAKKLKSLHLNNNRIDFIPNEVFSLKNLEELVIFENVITEIPKEIVQLEKLNIFDLRNNEIEGDLPHEICKLTALEKLSISGNQIKNIPLDVTKLEKLNSLLFDKENLDNNSPFKNAGLVELIKNISKHESENIKIGLVKIPEKFRTAFLQYLSFFDDYVREIKGKEINFSAKKNKTGVEIEAELGPEDSLAEINEYIIEYTSYLKNNLFKAEIDLGPIEVKNKNLSQEDFNSMVISLKSEIRHFQTKIEIASERIRILEDEKDYYKKQSYNDKEYIKNLLVQLVLSVKHGANPIDPNINISINNNPKVLSSSSSNMITLNYNITEVQDSFSDIIQYLKKDKKFNSLNFEDASAIQESLDNIENGSDKIEKNLSLKTKIGRFFRKILNTIRDVGWITVTTPAILKNISVAFTTIHSFLIGNNWYEEAKVLSEILKIITP